MEESRIDPLTMITIGMNYRVKPGKEEVFERSFNAVLDALTAAPGHVNSWLYKDTKDGTSYLILSEWNEQDKFNEFIRSESFARVTNWGKEQILSERPRHQVYESRQ
jgi:heme-degrading monooxygenase HmoA